MTQFTGRKIPLRYQVAIAAIIGVVLGSLQYIERFGDSNRADTLIDSDLSIAEQQDTEEAGTANPIVSQGAGPTPPAADGNDLAPSQSGEDIPLIYVSNELVLAPRMLESGIAGYEVVRNARDSRFSVGDIIVSVDNVAVDTSAAGGELLIAALRNEDATIQLHDQ